jgi:hypothetical protein
MIEPAACYVFNLPLRSALGPLRHLARHNEMSAVEVTAEVVQTSRDVAV